MREGKARELGQQCQLLVADARGGETAVQDEVAPIPSAAAPTEHLGVAPAVEVGWGTTGGEVSPDVAGRGAW